MARYTIRRAQCADCPGHIQPWDRQKAALSDLPLVPGQRYCNGGKKLRQFRPKDPKVAPPAWCPRLKQPAEYRVYAYKDSATWILQNMLRADGIVSSPSAHNYAVRLSGRTELTAKSFWEQVEDISPSKLLGVTLAADEVLEIDDGIKPHFFHICSDEVQYVPFFDAARARQNKFEGE